MSVSSARRRLAAAAVLATSLTTVTACQSAGKQATDLPSAVSSGSPTTGSSAPGPTTPTATAVPAANFKVGSALISDGTDTVSVDGTAVKFPTTVTDAAFSPDGSRIVFIDADGNVDTARPDGTSRMVVTKPKPGVKRSRPGWNGDQVLVTEKSSDGISRIMWIGSYEKGAASADETALTYDRSDQNGETAKGNSNPENSGAGLTYQHKGAKGPEVWIVDRGERTGDSAHKAADGSEPAVSPDGTKVAFVGANGQIAVEDATWFSGSGKPAPKPVQISFGLKNPAQLEWTPDGKSVAFSTATDVEQISATVASGAKDNPTTQLSAKPGVATFLPTAADKITRLGGDLITQAIAVSQARFASQDETLAPAGGGYGWPTATNIVLASSDDPSLALLGAEKARSYLAPLLFTPKAALDPRTAAEIKRALGKEPDSNKTPDPDTGYYLDNVFILGGTDVVSQAVEDLVTQLGYHVKRITAADKYAMAMAIQDLKPGTLSGTDQLTVVSADDPTAVAIAEASGWGRVLLTNGASMPDADKQILDALPKGIKVFAVGKAASQALASSWTGKPASLPVTAISGADEVALAQAASKATGSRPTTVVVIPAGSSQDAMIGAETAMLAGAGALYVADPASGLGADATATLDTASVQVGTAVVVDSGSKLATDLDAKISALIGGPLGAAVDPHPQGTIAR